MRPKINSYDLGKTVISDYFCKLDMYNKVKTSGLATSEGNTGQDSVSVGVQRRADLYSVVGNAMDNHIPEDATNSPVNYWENSGATDIVLWTGPREISTSVTDAPTQPNLTIPTR
jgi:hypothetical protein